MKRVLIGALATTVLSTGILASSAHALVQWDIDPSLSNFRLTVPDQSVTLGTITATMRLRNQNNTAWNTNNAPVDGLLATNVGLVNPGNHLDGVNSVQFLGGQSGLFGIDTATYRPNPAAYDTAVTDSTNLAGTFTNTSSGSQVYGARVNAQGPIALNVGHIGFDNVNFDVASSALSVTGTSFLSNTIGIGILDSQINFDGLSTIAGQLIGDTQAQSGPISATNVNGAAGSVLHLGLGNYRITLPFNVPLFVSLGGVNLNATATGTLVGFAFIPEPATLGLTGLGVAALAAHARRRRND